MTYTPPTTRDLYDAPIGSQLVSTLQHHPKPWTKLGDGQWQYDRDENTRPRGGNIRPSSYFDAKEYQLILPATDAETAPLVQVGDTIKISRTVTVKEINQATNGEVLVDTDDTHWGLSNFDIEVLHRPHTRDETVWGLPELPAGSIVKQVDAHDEWDYPDSDSTFISDGAGWWFRAGAATPRYPVESFKDCKFRIVYITRANSS